jgi:cytochrome P450
MSDETFVRKPEVTGYDAVRKAARNSADYSSDLLGDLDLRSYRHLPLEADPPRHTQLRLSMMPIFAADYIRPMMPKFRALAIDLFGQIRERGSGEIGRDVALPYAMGCLSIIFNRPQDAQQWIAWGPNVWLSEIYMAHVEITAETKRAQRERNYSVKTQRSAATLDEYLTRVLDYAEAHPRRFEDGGDVWDFLTQVTPGGTKMTRDEMLGTGSVLLAGGRDTVIKLITGFVWHLMRNEEDRTFLREHPETRDAAIQELARSLSPLPKMERLVPGAESDDDENRVLLSFVSANHDASVFHEPEKVDIHREFRPSVAFGFGRHSCLGLYITQDETLAFLDAILTEWPGWQFDGEPLIEWIHEGDGDSSFTSLDEFVSIPIRVP